MPSGDGAPTGEVAPDDASGGTTATDAAAVDDVEGGTDPDSPGDGGTAADTPSGGETSQPGTARGPTDGRRGRREIEVPQSLYRIVTVFSTLLSILLVVAGFSVLTMATTVLENPPASLVVQVLSLGVPMGTLVEYRTTLALGVGLAGLGLVAIGASVYVYGSRFRAPGMGKSKDASDEDSNDG